MPTPFEVRKQFLGTGVAVFPDLHFAFLGQVSRAVISGEVQLAWATTRVSSLLRWVGMMREGLLGAMPPAFEGQTALPAHRDLVAGGKEPACVRSPGFGTCPPLPPGTSCLDSRLQSSSSSASVTNEEQLAFVCLVKDRCALGEFGDREVTFF